MKLCQSKICAYIGAAALMLFILMALDFNLTKTFEIETDFESASPRITVLTPQERMAGGRIISEPVYFEVALPRAYDRVEVDLDYMNDGVDVIEIGSLEGEALHELVPVQHRDIDSLNWPCEPVEAGCRYVNPDGGEGVGVYKYSLPPDDDQPYRPQIEKTYDIVLIGPHRFVVQVSEGRLTFEAVGREISYELMRNGQPILSGDSINIAGLENGIYEVQVDAGSIESITTDAARWSIKNRVHLGSGSFDLIPSVLDHTVVVREAAGVQTLDLDGDDVVIDNPYRNYEVLADSSITVPHGNLIIQSGGTYAVDESLLLDPYPLDLGQVRDFGDLSLHEIYSSYVPGRPVILNLPDTHRPRFVISARGASKDTPIEVREARLRFERDTYDIKGYVTVWIQRLSDIFSL